MSPGRLARSGWAVGLRGAGALAGAATLGLASLSLPSGALAPGAPRAAVAVAGLGALALLVRRAARREPAPAPLAILARAPVTREAGLALVEADGRRLLVGYGQGGVGLLADLSPGRGVRP